MAVVSGRILTFSVSVVSQ